MVAQQLDMFGDAPPRPTRGKRRPVVDAPAPAPEPEAEPRVIACEWNPDDPAPLLAAGWERRDPDEGLLWRVRDADGNAYEVDFWDGAELSAACALLRHDPTVSPRDVLIALGAEEDAL